MPRNVSAVLLAAGRSLRMGRSKQLLPVNGRPAVRRCAETLRDAGIRDIVVVVGADGDEVSEALAGLPLRIVRNDDRDSDMAASVRIGLREVDPDATGIIVALADHPLVRPETVQDLADEHRCGPDAVLVPMHKRRRGHPSLFPRKVIEQIYDGGTLRDVLDGHSHLVRVLAVDDEGVILDMDTPEDYERIRDREEGRR